MNSSSPYWKTWIELLEVFPQIKREQIMEVMLAKDGEIHACSEVLLSMNKKKNIRKDEINLPMKIETFKKEWSWRRLQVHYKHVDEKILAHVFEASHGTYEKCKDLLQEIGYHEKDVDIENKKLELLFHPHPPPLLNKTTENNINDNYSSNNNSNNINGEKSYRDKGALGLNTASMEQVKSVQTWKKEKQACFEKANYYYHQYGMKEVAGYYSEQGRKLARSFLEKRSEIEVNEFERIHPEFKENPYFMDFHGYTREQVKCLIPYLVNEWKNVEHCKKKQDDEISKKSRHPLVMVVGKGRHSQNPKARIRHVVEKCLKDMQVDYRENEEGSVFYLIGF